MSKMFVRLGRESKEAGMVAIMVTLVLMIVISLIVLGFAQISRRNQRQALDRQLSTQAFYAAETGVNDATELIKSALASGTAVADKPDCASDGSGFYASLDSVIDDDSNVEYTCLMVDPTPNSLVYSSIGKNSTVVPLIAESGTISSVRLTWQSKDGSATPATTCPNSVSNVFSTTGNWTCGYGVLRFDLVPTAGSALSLGGLQDNTMTSFIVPLRPGSAGGVASVNYAAGGDNNRLGVVCSDSNCSLTINFAAPQSQYYMRISSVYKDVSLQVVASSGATPVSLQGAQGLIDATGKAEDVLRRIQVRVPLINSSTNLLSDYAIQSGEAICKRFSVMDGFFNNEADDAVAGVAASTTNPLCRP
jgi:Tfp pilus assembly protein PilX